MGFGNEKKPEEKHSVSNAEAESLFRDPNRLIIISHRFHEVRFICIGKSLLNRLLTSYYIIRNGKVRIIGTRASRKKEKDLCEKKCQRLLRSRHS
ncbi:BrnT family toxin [Dyadobacter sp. CY323]|uniref:BrnT family toxin n=1 Tax=Dyadobacter sp. CY323 TaxID=2907302 RepID=UPI0038D3A922